ncbi:MAG: biotin--[acetyl-CoA-carboxylase] ligase [Verrucomicrobiales bacterium]|nr:biotin--[acetyl-CoA-carboxylase] ligase [Verrucomicrobiales bacterium]
MSSSLYRSITQDWPTSDREVFPETSFRFLESTTSTSTVLRESVQRGESGHFSVLAADHQSAGRGRRGDRWEATPGSNLLFSLALELPEEPQHWSRLPHLTAMCVANAVESILTEAHPVLAKWPNDLYFGSRKFCGILVEITPSPRPFAIVGVGLNVNMKQADFPPELSGVATSICEVEGCEASRWYLLGLILQAFLTDYPGLLEDFDPVLEWYRERDFLAGKIIRVRTVNEEITGLASGLGCDGELQVVLESGEIRTIISAEKIEIC